MTVPGNDSAALSVEFEFAKKLSGNDKMQRDKAMRNLWRWLRSESESGKKFTEKDLLLVWKGLHYCMWMCDKPKVQDELATSIVKLSDCFESQPGSMINFFGAFFQTMAREYYRIDRFRIDKFLTLIRRMFHQVLSWLHQKSWKEKLVKDMFERLQRHVMSGDNQLCPEGLQGFLTEIFVQELSKVLEEHPSASVDFTELFTIFLDVLYKSNTPFLRKAITRNLFQAARKQKGILKLMDFNAIATAALDKGKQDKCSVKNRRALYNIYDLFSTIKRDTLDSAMEEDESLDDDSTVTAS